MSISRRLQDNGVAVVAEVGQAHGGDLGTALEYVDAAAACGVDAVKFQMHFALAESTSRESWRVNPGTGLSRLEYWKSMEFSRQAWGRIQDRCIQRGVEFFCSPFSPEALETLSELGVETIKIASGEALNQQLLDLALATGSRLVISNGLITTSELDAVVNRVTTAGRDLVILQCTTKYPTPPASSSIGRLPDLRIRYPQPIGLSDHSGTIYPALGAVALGASMVEIHLDLGRGGLNLDRESSLSMPQLRDLVKGVRFLEVARTTTFVEQDDDEWNRLRIIFGRSLVAARDLPAGTVVSSKDIAFKKPGGGLMWQQRMRILGKALRRSLCADEIILESDLT